MPLCPQNSQMQTFALVIWITGAVASLLQHGLPGTLQRLAVGLLVLVALTLLQWLLLWQDAVVLLTWENATLWEWPLWFGALIYWPGASLLTLDEALRLLFHDRPWSKEDYEPQVMMIYWMTLGAVFGSWFGALLIPLDWDRPWQNWPYVGIYGANVGLLGGLVIGAIRSYLHAQLGSEETVSSTKTAGRGRSLSSKRLSSPQPVQPSTPAKKSPTKKSPSPRKSTVKSPAKNSPLRFRNNATQSDGEEDSTVSKPQAVRSRSPAKSPAKGTPRKGSRILMESVQTPVLKRIQATQEEEAVRRSPRLRK